MDMGMEMHMDMSIERSWTRVCMSVRTRLQAFSGPVYRKGFGYHSMGIDMCTHVCTCVYKPVYSHMDMCANMVMDIVWT